MLKSRVLRDVATAGLLVLIIFTAALSAQSPANNELLKMIPAKSLFCVRINNFDYTLNQIDQFLAGASPMPLGVSMLVRMQLANLLGSPQLTGLNTNGSFAVFGVTMPGETTQTNTIPNMFIGVLAPVTDYKQFIDGNPNLSPPDANGVSKNTSSEFGGMLIKQVGNYALIGPSESGTFAATAKLISVKSAKLGSVLNAADAKQAETEPIWAYGNVQQVSGTFGSVISAKIEEIKTTMKSVEANQPEASRANIQNVMNMYAGFLETLMKETQSVSIAINPKPDVLNITKTISAVPGTDMAKMLTADATSQRENTLLTYLENGAIANFGATINTSFWKKLNVRSIDLFAMMSGDSMSAEDITEFKNLAMNVTDCLDGPLVYSFSSSAKNKLPFAVKYVVAVKDEKKFNQIIEKAMDIMNNSGIMDFYKSMGIETSFSMKRDVDSYKGISISSAKLSMKSTDANSPQAQMITSMYGDGFDYRWGMVDGLFACAVSGDVNSTIRE
ncbi:MAG TPA: hypothetical protein VMX36_15530, partial [Sedimentisphaerales bacterium]|nr:hypothetical protein [Sedimentisphaerales bacterium]